MADAATNESFDAGFLQFWYAALLKAVGWHRVISAQVYVHNVSVLTNLVDSLSTQPCSIVTLHQDTTAKE